MVTPHQGEQAGRGARAGVLRVEPAAGGKQAAGESQPSAVVHPGEKAERKSARWVWRGALRMLMALHVEGRAHRRPPP